MRRLARVLLTALLAIGAPTVVSMLGERAAFADDQPELRIGTQLEATADVTLHRAEIVKGSRVSVTKLLVRDGRLEGVGVALADGHVVKVTLSQVHTYFRVVQD